MRKLKIIFVFLIAMTSCSSKIKMPTGSMEPTIKMGEIVSVQYINDYIPKHGDIVLFKDINNTDKLYLKRCIAIEGDDFKLQNGFVFVNNKKLVEEYISGQTNYSNSSRDPIDGIVKKGYIIVLGDNRQNSFDSRHYGPIPIKNIIGIVEK